MNYIDLKICRSLAEQAYEGVTRRDGTPLMDHCARISNLFYRMGSIEMAATALLHDVLSKTPIALKDMADVCLHRTVLDTLINYEPKPEETWLDYIVRIKADPICSAIKVMEMTDDLLCQPTYKEYKEYNIAFLILNRWPDRAFFRDPIFDYLEIPEEQRIIPEGLDIDGSVIKEKENE